MKILLTGASGLLGRAVYKNFTENYSRFEILGTAYSRTSGDLVKLDLLDTAAVNKLISDFKPGLIIHSAAERRPDEVKANPERAQKVNVEATGTVAEAAAEIGAAILYMSTNYVFDGRNPPYFPDSETNPLNDYGKMKLAGEKAVEEKCPGAIILRIPILYGNCEYLGESAVTLMAEGISADKVSYFDNKMIRFPTHSGDIAEVIAGLAQQLKNGENIKGIYQCSSEIPYTKYTMARIMAEALELNPELIHEAEPDPNAAPRPVNAKLDTGRLQKLGLGSYRDFNSAVKEILFQHIDKK